MSPFFEDHLRVPKAHVLLGQIALEVLVDADPDPFWPGDNPKDCRLSVPDVHRIGKHVEDGEVMFDDNDRAFRGEFPYQLGCRDTLVDIQKWRDLIEEIEIGVSCKAGGDCHPLEFSSAQGAIGWSRIASSLSAGMNSSSLPLSSVVLSRSRVVPENIFGIKSMY